MEKSSLFYEFLRWKKSKPNEDLDASTSEASEASEASSLLVAESPPDPPENSPADGLHDSSPATSSAAKGSGYTAEQYLQQGGKGEAAKNFHHILKTAALEARVWGSGFSAAKMTPAQRKHIHDRIIDECPSLKGHGRDIDKVLGRSIANCNYYQRKKVFYQRNKDGKSGPIEAGPSKVSGSSKSSVKVDGGTKSKFKTVAKTVAKDASDHHFIKNDNVVLLHNKEPIGLGKYLRQLSELYSEVIFLEHLDGGSDVEDLELPEEVSKNGATITKFKDLERDDIVVWKKEKMNLFNAKRNRKVNTLLKDFFTH